MLLLSSADFFFKIKFSKNYFRNSIGVSNGLDPEPTSVGSDLSPNCLHRLSVDDKFDANRGYARIQKVFSERIQL